MAGHSKWNNIKNRKGAQDKKRAKIFGKVSRDIRIAVKEGKSEDPEHNPSLRTALDKAREANMPKENIQRAIDRGMGRGKDGPVKELIYEGYGPQGVAVIITALTDNTQRTSSEVRHILNKAGGSLGGPNSAMYLFERTDDGSYESTMPMDISDNQELIDTLEELSDTLTENDDVEEVFFAATWED